MGQRTVETLVGLFVAAGIGALVILAVQVSNLVSFGAAPGYQVTAYFDDVGGLRERGAVRAGGVTVGRVTSIQYDQRTYKARVTISVDPRYDRFPRDTLASIYTSGLLGEQYINLDPGGDIDYLADGDTIEYTESAVVLEQLIGRFIYQQSGD